MFLHGFEQVSVTMKIVCVMFQIVYYNYLTFQESSGEFQRVQRVSGEFEQSERYTVIAKCDFIF